MAYGADLRMRPNARGYPHDGQERSAPRKGGIQKRKTTTAILKIQLARPIHTVGRAPKLLIAVE
jgi:hypothetical protein